MNRMVAMLALGLTAAWPQSATAAETPPSGLEWSVFNPFRFYKNDRQFQRHLAEYKAIVAGFDGETPGNIVEATENGLNARKCSDPSTPANCRATWSGNFEADRLGWAHDSLGSDETCYLPYAAGGDAPYRYDPRCRRESGPGAGDVRDEDYVKPDVHAIEAKLTSALVASNPGGCVWTLTPAGGEAETERAKCSEAVVIRNVPYRPGDAADGGVLVVRDESGKELARDTITVKDTLVIGLGDSFGSGEGNPDRPVRFAAPIPSVTYSGAYQPSSWPAGAPAPGGWPFRLTQPPIDQPPQAGDGFPGLSDATAYYDARAQWTSPDCHRSQYSYQFRAALEMAIEDPHRAVTLIHLACSGADALVGVFGPMTAKELLTAPNGSVASQLQTVMDLLCDDAPTIAKTFTLPKPVQWGGAKVVDAKEVTIRTCTKLKRAPDLMFLSLGGNDVGFAPMVGYAIMPSPATVAPVAMIQQWFGGDRFIFAPQRAYLAMMRRRLQVTAGALEALLHVDPSQVVQTDYENLPVDAHNQPCKGTAGMDGVPGFAYIPGNLRKVIDYALGVPSKNHQIGFFDTLRCTTQPDKTCGPGWDHPTGFHYIDTQAPFESRGVCAFADAAETVEGAMPRADTAGSSFAPFLPNQFLPYAPRRRLFVTVNDSYLKANTQIDCPFSLGCSSALLPPIADRLQLAFAGLYGGAFHRSAEGHAVVADAIMDEFLRAWLKTH